MCRGILSYRFSLEDLDYALFIVDVDKGEVILSGLIHRVGLKTPLLIQNIKTTAVGPIYSDKNRQSSPWPPAQGSGFDDKLR